MNRVISGLRIPVDLNEELVKSAKKMGISKNALILQILWDWLNAKDTDTRDSA